MSEERQSVVQQQSQQPAPTGLLQRQCACGQHNPGGGECESCKRKRLQRAGDGPAPDVAPPIVHEVLSSPGRPLEAATRAALEPRFGHDFSRVRVHTDSRAADSAAAVGALAYTVGSQIAFGTGQYAPGTPAGDRLLAHELAHTVQQRGVPAGVQTKLAIEVPGSAAEQEADRAASAALKGAQLPQLNAHAVRVRRAVRERVVSSNTTNAQACLIHLHRDEQNALQAATTLHGSHCTNFVHLSTGTTRAIHVDPSSGTGAVCTADPNRIFSATGIRSHAIQGACPASRRPQVERDLITFRDQELLPAITACRRGTNTDQPLPVVAFHNNTPGNLSIRSYRPGGSEAGATETNATRLGGSRNPREVPGEDPDNFFLTTDPRDFATLGASRNTVLQAATPTDDGSLSVALAGTRYINVEAEGKPFTSTTSTQFVTNLAMGREALTALGVSTHPCPQPAATGAAQPGGQTRPLLQRRETGRRTGPGPRPEPATNEPEPSRDSVESFIDWLFRLVGEIQRVLDQLGTMPTPMARETPPANLPQGCRTFTNQADLDTRKAHWAGQIGSMAPLDVVDWIVGVARPPTAAQGEAEQQRDCMLHAIRASASRPGSPLHLPSGTMTHSGYRDAAAQGRIWREKFEFTRARPFDRISDHARRICGSLLLPSEHRWDTRNQRHRACWGVAPSSGATAPAMPTGARNLNTDERQQEILQASSAPGISRHHWGTDFDLFDPDMNPTEWQAGGSFADEYSWMMRNASTYGFIQSFTATSTFMGRGYIEERWHWSYYPVAQALVDFAHSHQTQIESALVRLWSGNPTQFSFVRRNWRDYMFNVSERGRF